MNCPACNYLMSDFDTECLRCHGQGLSASRPPHGATPATSAATPLMEAQGLHGTIALTADRVIIKHMAKKLIARQGARGGREIMLRSIASVQFKKAGKLTGGSIRIVLHGQLQGKGAATPADQCENTLTFTAAQQSAFERLKLAIEQRVVAAHLTPAYSPDPFQNTALQQLAAKK